MEPLIITKRDLRRLRERAIRAQQREQAEICGVLLLEARLLHLVFLPNRSAVPLHFELAKADIQEERSRASATGRRLVGTFHSHPIGYAVPSDRDLQLRNAGRLQLIYDVCARTAKLWLITRRRGDVVVHEVALGVAREA